MSAAKHTPGPWDLVVGDESCSSEIFVLRNDLQVHIADVNSHVFGAGHADAYLIAAAPEMLQALHDALNNLPKDGECAELVRAAIAKAAGVAL